MFALVFLLVFTFMLTWVCLCLLVFVSLVLVHVKYTLACVVTGWGVGQATVMVDDLNLRWSQSPVNVHACCILFILIACLCVEENMITNYVPSADKNALDCMKWGAVSHKTTAWRYNGDQKTHSDFVNSLSTTSSPTQSRAWTHPICFHLNHASTSGQCYRAWSEVACLFFTLCYTRYICENDSKLAGHSWLHDNSMQVLVMRGWEPHRAIWAKTAKDRSIVRQTWQRSRARQP